jgi:hypothetical protein
MAKLDYSQTNKVLNEVAIAGFSFKTILTFVGQPEKKPDDYNFFIHSNSVKAAVQLLNDKSIITTYRLYCENDDVVTIIVRPEIDPSPNSSQCPSAPESLRQRRKISGKRNLSEVFIQPIIPKETENLDAESLLPIKQLLGSEKVALDLGQGKTEIFSAAYLLGEFSYTNLKLPHTDTKQVGSWPKLKMANHLTK